MTTISTQQDEQDLILYSQYIPDCCRNFIQAYEFVNQLFQERSRLLVIRVDFSTNKKSNQKKNPYFLREHLNQLLNNKRQNNIFTNNLAYIWTLEYAEETGYHYHCFFFYDGAYSQQDLSLGHGIGRYWMQLTPDEGTYYCSNDDKFQFEQLGTCGIGMISRSDFAKRNNLTNLLGYLFKDQPSTRAEMVKQGVGNVRLFGKGRS